MSNTGITNLERLAEILAQSRNVKLPFPIGK